MTPTDNRFNEMAASTACTKCGASSIRPSRWRPKDGVLRRLWSTSVRCQVCGYRERRFSAWNVAATLAILLLIAFIVGIVVVLASEDWHHAPDPLASARIASLSS